jgi:hypothetical protein
LGMGEVGRGTGLLAGLQFTISQYCRINLSLGFSRERFEKSCDRNPASFAPQILVGSNC